MSGGSAVTTVEDVKHGSSRLHPAAEIILLRFGFSLAAEPQNLSSTECLMLQELPHHSCQDIKKSLQTATSFHLIFRKTPLHCWALRRLSNRSLHNSEQSPLAQARKLNPGDRWVLWNRFKFSTPTFHIRFHTDYITITGNHANVMNSITQDTTAQTLRVTFQSV